MTVRCRIWAPVAGAVLCLMAARPAVAFQAQLERYYAASAGICRTGVTAAISAAYEEARRALERARPGGGPQNGNFAGLKNPAELWLDCFQSPGDGKT